MPTILTLKALQISEITYVPQGSRITSSGNGYIEWTSGSLTDARNAPNWAKWGKNIAAGYMDTVRPMSIRAVATGAMTVTIQEGGGDKYGANAYFEEDTPYLSTDSVLLMGPNGYPINTKANTYKSKAVLIGDSITAYNGVATAGTAGAVDITSVNGVATVTHTGHQILIGQAIWVSSSSVTAQNGFWTVASIIDANSYTYNHGSGSGTDNTVILHHQLRNNADGLFTWFNALAGAKYDLIRNYGSPGARTDDVIDLLDKHWKEDGADEAFVMIGINDIVNDVALATIIANTTKIYDFILSRGITLNILTTLPLHSTHVNFSIARMKVTTGFVEWQKQFAMSRLNTSLSDTHAIVVDPASVDGSAKAALLGTGIHPNEVCANLCAKQMVTDKFNGQTLTPAGRWPSSMLDGQEKNTDSWNLLANPMMILGAGGTLTGAVGTIAEGVTATHTVVTGTPNTSFTCSLVARTDGGNNQRGVAVFNANAQTATFTYTGLSALLIPGATYRIGVNATLTDCTNLNFFTFEATITIGGFVASIRALTQGSAATDNNFPSDSGSLWLESQEFTIPLGSTITGSTVTAKLQASGAGGATLDMGRPKFELVRY